MELTGTTGQQAARYYAHLQSVCQLRWELASTHLLGTLGYRMGRFRDWVSGGHVNARRDVRDEGRGQLG